MPHRRPTPDESNSFYHGYIAKVPDGSIVEVLERSRLSIVEMFSSLPADKWLYRYAPGKWTVKEVFLHMIDGERVFAYRALRIARGDATPMAGFDEQKYVPNSLANERSPASLLQEFDLVRRSTLALLEPLDPPAWDRRGVANDAEVSLRALAYIIGGHALHHTAIVLERYR